MSAFWSDIARRLAGKTGQEESKPEKPIEKPDLQWIVGLDFGTSGSKVVVRDALRPSEEPIAIDFGTPAELGFNRFIFPSTVAVRDGVLHFGFEAEYEAMHTPHVFRSLKRDFLRISRPTPGRAPGRIDPTLSAIDDRGLVAEFLVTLYMADILRRTWRAMSIHRRDFSPDSAMINLDVPVATLDPSGSGATFLRMLRIGRQLASQLRPGETAAELGNSWLDIRGSLPPPLSPGDRLEELVPEAVAAIGGLGEAARHSRDIDNWVVVDIGAGTTDIGFFRYPDRDGRRAVFYSARTSVIGCDDVDRAICAILGKENPSVEELGAVRLAKTRVGSEDVRVFDGTPLTTDHLEEAIATIRAPADNAWGRAFGEAYQKDMGEDRWRRLDVFVVGGGSLTPGFKRIYQQPPRPTVRKVIQRRVDSDIELASAGNGAEPPQDEDLIFLLAALGLSLPPTDRPEMVHPDEVPASPPPPKGPTGDYDFDADDMFSG
jgi:hypothetical protein